MLSPLTIMTAQTENDSYFLPYAAQPDIVQAHQKDVYFKSALFNRVSGILRSIIGPRHVHFYQQELRTAVDFVYLGLMAILGTRTLGEEYCDIMQTQADSQKMPSILRRSGFVLSKTMGAYILLRSWPNIKKAIRNPLVSQTESFSKEESSVAAHYRHKFRIILVKNFTRQLSPEEQRAGYEGLGFILLLQLLAKGYFAVSASFTEPQESKSKNSYTQPEKAELPVSLEDLNVSSFIDESARKCALCLSFIENATVSPCGHLFCWTCIYEWCQNKV
ncbi:Peroxisome biogenesis factor 10 [Neolecta irregularis DAH-3]|uniref:RING-type E3 ubiquitin transferase n=1 Tax=Neolecta irregularis (strain DAH-3) TaxID=1198029 RepID=A0A1U7LWA6_NEOID|nr:Peroxisome biogenesis factor 10 [Neolecta irregularis DAH-3]|eukprot:OLL26853.1 Peroxisome biogenesis factor 10 [Neolecta irregularis DAH-3]